MIYNSIDKHTHTHTHLHTTLHHTHVQGEHLRLFPLSATASPNISSDEHNLSDGEVINEHLYSLGRFLPTNKQPGGSGGGSGLQGGSSTRSSATITSQSVHDHSSPESGRHKTSSNVPIIKRRVTHSIATSNLLAESYERGSLASAEETPPPSGYSSPMLPLAAAVSSGHDGGHKPLSPQRSNTFSIPKSGLHQQVVSYDCTLLIASLY